MNVNMNAINQGLEKIPTFNKSDENKELRKKTDEFESVILKMLLDNAMKDEKNIFSENDPGEKIYKSMYREQLSKDAAGNFGFSQMLYDHLTKQKVSSSR